MNKTLMTAFLALFLLSAVSAQTIQVTPLNPNASTLNVTASSLNVTASSLNVTASSLNANTSSLNANATTLVSQVSLNLSAINAATQQELGNSLYLVGAASLLDKNSTLVAALQRKYTDGTNEYTLFFENDNGQGETPEAFQAIVKVVSPSQYFLVDVLIVQNTTVTSVPDIIVAPNATTLTQLATKLSEGFSLLTSAQIAQDAQLKTIDAEIQKLNSLSGVTITNVANKISDKETRYRVFYSSGSGDSFKFTVGQALYNTDTKILYIIDYLTIQTPTSLAPQ